MLTHLTRHGDGETRGRGDKEKGRKGERDTSRSELDQFSLSPFLPFSLSPLLRVALFVSAALVLACGSKPVDPRTVIPGDALVYLESNDLGKTLAVITENAKFQQLAKKKPDLSALSGVRFAAAVTGFETSEQTLTEENSVLRFQPHFVAVIETNAWGWQTTAFIENGLGEFVNEAYGGEVELETTPRNDGKLYVWSSAEGRKAYALQQGSLVFFGNDESAIERCQAVQRGELDSIAKNSKVTDGDRLAFGYISSDGIAQIANIAGISLAMGASEEEEVKGFVARVLPEILRNSVKEMTWTATSTDAGVEDKINVEVDEESARVFAETIVPVSPGGSELIDLIPPPAVTATRYLLRDPQIAWRSMVLTAGKKTDESSGSLLVAFSGSLFEPYGVEDAELFLSSVGSPIVTVKLAAENEDAAVIASIKDVAKVKKAIAEEINFTKPAEKQFGADVWRSDDGEFAAAFLGDTIVVSGDAETVLKCLEAKQMRAGGQAIGEHSRQFSSSDAVAVTVANETENLRKLIDMISDQPDGVNEQVTLSSRTETRFNRNGIERRTVSDFGLIGSIIERLAQE